MSMGPTELSKLPRAHSNFIHNKTAIGLVVRRKYTILPSDVIDDVSIAL